MNSLAAKPPSPSVPVLATLESLEARRLFAGSPLPAPVSFQAPIPAPALPTGFDTFNPSLSSSAASTNLPVISEYTRAAAPDQAMALTGNALATSATGSDASFVFYGQSGSAPGHFSTVTPTSLANNDAALTLPADLPTDSMYLLWPVSSAGTGAPVAVNQTDAWWVGSDHAAPGDTVSVFGQNLTLDDGKSYVYLKPLGGAAGTWATVTAVNPYKVDFIVPPALAPGQYEVWSHNGHGGKYGWSKADNTLTVAAAQSWSGPVFNVRAFGATGDGHTDDQAAIERALEAAAKVPYSTVYLPAGTYSVSMGFNPTNNVRWLGDGASNTILRANAAYTRGATPDSRHYSLLFVNSGLTHAEFDGLTLDANHHLNGYLNELVYFRFASDIRFDGVRFLAPGSGTFDFHGSSRVFLSDSSVVGPDGFLGSASQVFFDHVAFYGTDDTVAALSSWGGDQLSVTHCSAQDYDPTSPTGWSAGRFFYDNGAWGSARDIYLGDNATTDLSVRPSPTLDQNAGEQVLFEGHNAVLTTHPTRATNAAPAVSLTAALPVHPSTTTALAGTSTVNAFSGVAITPTAPAATLTLPAPLPATVTAAPTEYDVVVTAGRGAGQHRRILAVDPTGTTLTLQQPFAVLPDASSTVTVTAATERVVVYHNSFDGKDDYATRTTASAGVEFFDATFDAVVDDNTFHQLRNAIYTVAIANPAATAVAPSYFNLFADNAFTDVLRGVYAGSVYGSSVPTAASAAASYVGNVFRDNTLQNTPAPFVLDATGAPRGGKQILLTLFDHNTIYGSVTNPITFLGPSSALDELLNWQTTLL